MSQVLEPLAQARVAILKSASRAQVALAVSHLILSPDGEWFPNGNVYVPRAHDRLVADGKSVPVTGRVEFAQYLAASTFVHCGDAWGYLGRALGALLQGDLQTAVHLTYYAELRSAISLLASEGIYIGNSLNLSVSASGEVFEISREGTHRAVWKCLAAWNDLPRSGDLIGRVLRPGGPTLHSWASGLSGAGVDPVIHDLLRRMAMDLQSFSMDHNRRNSASYGPTRLITDDLDAVLIQRIVSELWQALEPGVGGSFPVMDAVLLQDILANAYGATHTTGGGVETDWSRWGEWLAALMPAQSVGSALEARLRDWPNSDGGGNAVLKAAFEDTSSQPLARDFVAAMLSRTTVLLRLSTGSCIDLMDAAGIETSSVEPWVDSLGVARGIWTAGEVPDSKLDLWADIEVAKQDLEDADAHNHHSFVTSLGPSAATLSQAERVVAWSFGA